MRLERVGVKLEGTFGRHAVELAKLTCLLLTDLHEDPPRVFFPRKAPHSNAQVNIRKGEEREKE